jgi:hypothetical protein
VAPTSERVVEDVDRLIAVLGKTIAAGGDVVLPVLLVDGHLPGVGFRRRLD